MIVYGTRSTLLKSELIHEPCPNCKSNFSVQMNVFQKYAHIFWIPCFPISKTGVSVCGKCQQVLKLEFMPDPLKSSYVNMASQIKAPVWTFSGIGVVAIIVIAISISDSHRTETKDKYVVDPHVGDILQVKLDSVYTTFKITAVDKDSINFLLNKYQTDDETGISDLEEKGYDTASYIMARSKLIKMNKEDNVIDIERK